MADEIRTFPSSAASGLCECGDARYGLTGPMDGPRRCTRCGLERGPYAQMPLRFVDCGGDFAECGPGDQGWYIVACRDGDESLTALALDRSMARSLAAHLLAFADSVVTD